MSSGKRERDKKITFFSSPSVLSPNKKNLSSRPVASFPFFCLPLSADDAQESPRVIGQVDEEPRHLRVGDEGEGPRVGSGTRASQRERARARATERARVGRAMRAMRAMRAKRAAAAKRETAARTTSREGGETADDFENETVNEQSEREE